MGRVQTDDYLTPDDGSCYVSGASDGVYSAIDGESCVDVKLQLPTRRPGAPYWRRRDVLAAAAAAGVLLAVTLGATFLYTHVAVTRLERRMMTSQHREGNASSASFTV